MKTNNPNGEKRQHEIDRVDRHLNKKGFNGPFVLEMPFEHPVYKGTLRDCLDTFLEEFYCFHGALTKCSLKMSFPLPGLQYLTNCELELHYSEQEGFRIPKLHIRNPGFKLDVTRKAGDIDQLPTVAQVRDLVWVEKAARAKSKRFRK